MHVDKLTEIILSFRSNYLLISPINRSHKPSKDKWSKREIVGHLIDSARYNLLRFTEIINTEGIYVVKSYDQDKLVTLNDYQNTSDTDLLHLWQLLNHNIVTILKSTDRVMLQKQIIIGNEPFTLGWLIDDYIAHLHHHMKQIFDGSAIESPPFKIGLDDAVRILSNSDRKEFVNLANYADLEVEYYKPNKIDKQQPHLKDEVYVIASGKGAFTVGKETVNVKTGDVLFVKAGDEHRFTEFSDDFATWVIFYGIQNLNIL